jgi:hypothetical protein
VQEQAAYLITLAILVAFVLAVGGCASKPGGAFDAAGAPSGDVDAIAGRCISADLPGQTTGTFEMHFPHCSGM